MKFCLGNNSVEVLEILPGVKLEKVESVFVHFISGIMCPHCGHGKQICVTTRFLVNILFTNVEFL